MKYEIVRKMVRINTNSGEYIGFIDNNGSGYRFYQYKLYTSGFTVAQLTAIANITSTMNGILPELLQELLPGVIEELNK